MQLFITHKFRLTVSSFDVKRGDDLLVDLVFLDEDKKVVMWDFDEIIFGAKAPKAYTGNYLLYADQFVLTETPDGKRCLRGVISLNTAELADLIGDNDEVSVLGEFVFRGLGYSYSSQTINIAVSNDVIKGNESLPSDTAPDFATKQYVDGVVRDKMIIGKGDRGDDGSTPEIGVNGNWWINGKDTFVPAVTDLSGTVKKSELGALMDDKLITFAETYAMSEEDYNNMQTKREHNIYVIATPKQL